MDTRDRFSSVEDLPHADGGWQWRNLRAGGIGIELWWFPWRLFYQKDDDQFGGRITIEIGPLSLVFHYNAGATDMQPIFEERSKRL